MSSSNQDSMRISRRSLIRGVAVGSCLAAVGPLRSPAAVAEKSASGVSENAYKYRIAFGAWINDMRNEPLPLEDWPAPQMDEETIRSAIAAMDVQSEAGFNYLDAWGLFATKRYPLDIVSVFNDKDRRQRVNQLIAAGAERGIKLFFGLGLMSWGYDEIIQRDPEVRDPASGSMPHAMCSAKKKSWSYVKKIIDTALTQYDFCGVHLESADQGWCQCPKCAGKDGSIGYNIRLNTQAAQYIKSKWPDKLVTVIPINWLAATRRWFNEDDKKKLIEMSKHIDCFMDQGWRGTYIADKERRDFISKLHCDYATSADAHLYHSVRWDRSTYFLPYVRRMGEAIKLHYDEGARGCMFYQGPVSNPATEINIAAGGRMLRDTTKKPEDALAESIELYYKPKSEVARQKLADIFLRAEEAYCSGWDPKAFTAGRDPNSPWIGMPGEFYINEKLNGNCPGAATYLLEPYLNAAGRKACMQGLMSLLKDLAPIENSFNDRGRIERIKRGMIVTLNLISTIQVCKGES